MQHYFRFYKVLTTVIAMDFLRKFNIRTRLAAMSITLIIFTIIMGAIGFLNIESINKSTNIIFNNDVRSLTYLQSIRDSFLKVGSSLRDIAVENGKSDWTREGIENLIYIIQNYYMDMADDVINFTSTLEKFEGTEEDIQNIKKIENLIENDFREVVNTFIKEARNGAGLEELSNILSTGNTTVENLDQLINDMYNQNLDSIRLMQIDSNNTAISTRNSIIILNIIILLISILMGQVITRSVSTPINKLLEIASKITKGDFDVHIESNYKDEVGNLTKRFSQLINTIKTLISEMEQMSEKQANGNIDAVIDESKFAGNYLKVAQGTNKMMTDLVNDMLSMTECLAEFGKGNFNADIPKFSNKKAVMNQSIDELRTNLKVVSEEINTLMAFATSGDLKKRADFSKYSGDWATIIIGLNNLLEAIVEPINEASFALQKFSQGNLDTSMKGEYKGDFAIIKQSINMTVEFIASYVTEIDRVLSQLVNNKDFNVGIKREYIGDFVTIKENINKIIYTFNGIMTQMNEASFKVSESAGDITASSQSLSDGTLTQSNMINNLNIAIDVFEKQTVHNAENSKKANEFAGTANQSAVAANTEMQGMLEAMGEINASSMDISKILKVINDISFQTNLLAINAAIEAAKAGVHGKGFSIVAEEVRSLASKSKESADQTARIIENTLKKVSDGSNMANKTALAIDQIVSQINSISVFISEIDASSRTQAENIIQINQDIVNILQVAKDAKTSSEASLVCSEELLHQSNLLKTMVEEFNLVKSY